MTRGLQRIGKYKIERRLGSGSFATVWLAHDEDLDSTVAIKMLATNWSADEDVKRRFLQEARMLYRLNDPRVIRVYTTGEHDDGCPYFVMDYADRGALEERVSERQRTNRPYELVEALTIAREIAGCVAVIHRAAIVHRDLKPSNILYCSDLTQADGERMLLGDFGIARTIDAGGAKSTIVAGSPFYMAPEQAEEATARTADHRADVYACTVMLYELLAGRVPYPYATISEIRRAQEAGSLTPLGELRANLPDSVERIVERGMQLDPAQRYPDIDAWGSAIDAALAEIATTLAVGSAGEATLLTEDGVNTTVDPPPVAKPAARRADPVASPPVVLAAEPVAAVTEPAPPSQPKPSARDVKANPADHSTPRAATPPPVAPPVPHLQTAGPSPPPRVVSEDEARRRRVAQGSAEAQSLDAAPAPATKPKRRIGLAALLVTAALVGGGYAYNELRDTSGNVTAPTPTLPAVAEATATVVVFETPTLAPADTAVPFSPTTLVATDDFSDPLFSIFPTISGTNQSSTISNGQYQITATAGEVPHVTETTTPFARGYANVNAWINGDGSAGLVARERQNADFSQAFETCWVTSAGSAGCAAWGAAGWETYFTVPNGTVTLYGGDLLTMQIDQGSLIFWVNSVYVGQATVDPEPTGYWGISAGNYSGTSTAWFDAFTLTKYNDPT